MIQDLDATGGAAPASLAHRRVIGVLGPLYVVSGVTAYGWLVVWIRQLELLLGVSSAAIATMTTVSLVGLALGGGLSARWADRARRPLRAFAAVELGVALWGLAFPWLLRFLEPIWLAWPIEGVLEAASGAVRALVTAAALLPGTVLLGASLPLLARFVVVGAQRAGPRVAVFAGLHALGAAFGAFLCGFVVLPWVGQDTTAAIVGAAHVAVGVLALLLDAGVRGRTERPRAVDGASPPVRPALLIALVMGGFAATVQLVAWTRILALVLGATVYLLPTLMVTVLAGLALGGLAGGPLADLASRRRGSDGALLAFGAIEGVLALCSFALLYVWPELPLSYVTWFEALGPGGLLAFLLTAQVAFLPAVLMGLRLPSALAVLVGADEVGRRVGAVRGAEALGAALGAALAPGVLIPALGMQRAAMLAVVLDLVAAGLVVTDAERRTRWEFSALPPVALLTLLFAFTYAAPGWEPLWMTAATHRYRPALREPTRAAIVAHAIEGHELLFYEEGPTSTVTLVRLGPTEHMWLASDGVLEASSVTDRPTEVLLGALPLQFTDHPKRALVIGLGSGITAGVVADFEAVQRVDVVELEPTMRKAALWFGDLNHDVVTHRKVHLVTDDARAHVLRAEEATWDLIVNAPSSPSVPSAATLYTREFFELGRSRMTSGGVWAQWVPLYGLGSDELRSLLRTFAEVFPNVVVYATIDEADLVLVGSEVALARSSATVESLARSTIVQDLVAIGIRQPSDLLVKNLFSRDTIVTFCGDAPINTDNHRFVAYAAPLLLPLDPDSRGENWELMRSHARPATDVLPPDPYVWVDLARAYQAHRDTDRAVATMLAAVERLPPSNPTRNEWLAEAQRWQARRDKEAAKKDLTAPEPDAPAP